MSNVALYMESIQLDSHLVASSPLTQTSWTQFLSHLDTFLRKFHDVIPTTTVSSKEGSGGGETSAIITAGVNVDLSPLLRIIMLTFKLPVMNSCKGVVLDSYYRTMGVCLQSSPCLPYKLLLESCQGCLRAFSKERDKFTLTRAVAQELQSAIRLKVIHPDNNLMTMLQFVLQDCGGSLVPSLLTKHLPMNTAPEVESFTTGAGESFKVYFNDCIDFIADIHALRRVKVCK